MSYNTKNYTEQGGDTTHFGGRVIFEEGCRIEGIAAANQADSTATTVAGLKEDFNALLAKLVAAGLMAAAAPAEESGSNEGGGSTEPQDETGNTGENTTGTDNTGTGNTPAEQPGG